MNKLKEDFMKKNLFLLVTALLCTIVASAFAQFDDVEIKVTPVAGNIYMLVGAGGNIGVSVGEDGILMIDDQFRPLAEKIQTALSNFNKGDLKFVLNTHVHGDHVGGNTFFGEHATIIAQDNVRKRMIEDFNNKDEKAQGKQAWPVITFENSVSVHFNYEEIKVIHLPAGHTDGDAVIYFTKSNVVHTGDLMFSGLFPFVDLESGGTVDGYIADVTEIISNINDSTLIIPGHGPLSKLSDYKTFQNMLLTTTKIVRDYVAEGKTLDEIIALGLGDQWKDWSWSFISTERWITTIYNDTKK